MKCRAEVEFVEGAPVVASATFQGQRLSTLENGECQMTIFPLVFCRGRQTPGLAAGGIFFSCCAEWQKGRWN